MEFLGHTNVGDACSHLAAQTLRNQELRLNARQLSCDNKGLDRCISSKILLHMLMPLAKLSRSPSKKVRVSSLDADIVFSSQSPPFSHTRNFTHSWLVPSSSYRLTNQLIYIRKQSWSSSRRSRTSTSRRSLPLPRTMPYLPTMMMMTTQTQVRLLESYVMSVHLHNVRAYDLLHGSNTNPNSWATYVLSRPLELLDALESRSMLSSSMSTKLKLFHDRHFSVTI